MPLPTHPPHLHYSKHTETLNDASKEIGVEVNADKLYVPVSSPECKKKSYKDSYWSFENVAQLKYLRRKVTNQNFFRRKLRGS
jgi:hypothetical protein